MTPSLAATPPLEEFSVHTTGEVVGTPGDARLAETLGYVVRLTTHLADLLGVGDAHAIRTTGPAELALNVRWTPAREPALGVRVRQVPSPAPRHIVVVRNADVQDAVQYCVERATGVEGVLWSAIVTDDRRAVATTAPLDDDGTALGVVQRLGYRALAVAAALPERFRDDTIVVAFSGAVLLLTPLDAHVLVSVSDRLPGPDWSEATEEIRAVLAPHLVERARAVRAPGR